MIAVGSQMPDGLLAADRYSSCTQARHAMSVALLAQLAAAQTRYKHYKTAVAGVAEAHTTRKRAALHDMGMGRLNRRAVTG